MISIAPLLLVPLFAGSGLWLGKSSDARRARQLGVILTTVALVFAAAALVFSQSFNPITVGPVTVHLMPAGLLRLAPLVTCMVALLAVGLAPLVSHRPATQARMLLLFACAQGFLSTSRPSVQIVLWVGSVWLTWRELRSSKRDNPWHRVFACYQLVSCALFIVGTLLLWWQRAPETGVLLVLLAIAIREGIIPFHSWFPRFMERAPMGIAVAFAAPQLGVYAHLRLLGADGVHGLTGEVAVFGAITAVLAAMFGVVQTNARRAVAYLILSQTGLVTFGLASHSEVGLTGALLNWQLLALATTGFAMVLAGLEARRGDLTVTTPHGNFAQTPKLGVAFLVLGFASVGFPLTIGFIAEDLLVQGTVAEFPILGLSLVVATAFNGVTVLRAFFCLFTGSGHRTGEPDLSRRESYLVGFAMAVLIALGMCPAPVVSLDDSGEPPGVVVGQVEPASRLPAAALAARR